MSNNVSAFKNRQEESYFVNDLIGTKVLHHGKKIGILKDIIIHDDTTLAVVTHLYVSRSFGNLSLLIPWENVRSVTTDEIVIAIGDIKEYETEPEPELIKLKDHILDKKVLDTEDRDIDVVYDIKLVMIENKLYVSDVDISKTGLLRRIGMGSVSKYLEKRSKQKKQMIPWKYIQPLPTPLGRFRGDVKLNILKEKLAEIHPVDLANILEELDYKDRLSVFEQLDTKKASRALEEIDPRAQRELIASLKKEKIAQLFTHMTSGQAADILSALPYSDVRTILHLLDERNVRKIKSIMNKQVEDILNYATSKFIKVSPEQTVIETRDGYNHLAKDKKIVMYLYVLDEKNKLLGVIDIKELLIEKENKKLKEIMKDEIISLDPGSSLKEALNLFERYDFRALPILDKENKILGVIAYRDVKMLKHRFLE